MYFFSKKTFDLSKTQQSRKAENMPAVAGRLVQFAQKKYFGTFLSLFSKSISFKEKKQLS